MKYEILEKSQDPTRVTIKARFYEGDFSEEYTFFILNQDDIVERTTESVKFLPQPTVEEVRVGHDDWDKLNDSQRQDLVNRFIDDRAERLIEDAKKQVRDFPTMFKDRIEEELEIYTRKKEYLESLPSLDAIK